MVERQRFLGNRKCLAANRRISVGRPCLGDERRPEPLALPANKELGNRYPRDLGPRIAFAARLLPEPFLKPIRKP